MLPRVVIFQHAANCHPGTLAGHLVADGIAPTIIQLDRGDADPRSRSLRHPHGHGRPDGRLAGGSVRLAEGREGGDPRLGRRARQAVPRRLSRPPAAGRCAGRRGRPGGGRRDQPARHCVERGRARASALCGLRRNQARRAVARRRGEVAAAGRRVARLDQAIARSPRSPSARRPSACSITSRRRTSRSSIGRRGRRDRRRCGGCIRRVSAPSCARASATALPSCSATRAASTTTSCTSPWRASPR